MLLDPFTKRLAGKTANNLTVKCASFRRAQWYLAYGQISVVTVRPELNWHTTCARLKKSVPSSLKQNVRERRSFDLQR